MKKVLKIILAAIVFAIISEVIHTVDAMFTMDFYKDQTYSQVWSKIMMPSSGQPPAEFYYLSIAFTFIGGLLFTIVYLIIEKGLPGATVIKKGLNYGFLMFLVGGISGYLAMILLINLPMMLLVYWAIEGLIINLICGIVIARINK